MLGSACSYFESIKYQVIIIVSNNLAELLTDQLLKSYMKCKKYLLND